MIPNNSFSATPQDAPYLYPDDERIILLEDFEDGGVEIEDTSEGLTGYRWRCFVDNGDICIQRDGLPKVPIIISPGQVNCVALAFDQNMQPTVAYELNNGSSYLRWYDTAIPGYTTTEFVGCSTPGLSLDDKRPSQIQVCDIIFAYIRNNTLYYRMQRDRYEIEYLITSGLPNPSYLINVGMTENLRLKFKVSPLTP